MTQSAFSTGRETVAGDVRARMAMSMATILIALCSAASPAFAQCQYEVTAIIEAPPCGEFLSSPTVGRGMNNAGHVCGFYVPCGFGNDEAFYWTPEIGFVTLPRPAGVARAWANDISDTGLIVGNHEFTGIGIKGFVYDIKTGEFTHLEPLHDGVIATNLSIANAVNNNGLVAGSRSITKPGEPNVYNAVIWDTNTGKVIDLGVMNGPNSDSTSINDSGVAVGWAGSIVPTVMQAWRFSDGEIQFLGPIPSGTTSLPREINEQHVVVGNGLVDQSKIPGISSLPAIWHDKWQLLGLLEGHTAGGAWGINDVLQVVGTSTFTGGPSSAFLWQLNEMFNLNDLIVGSELIVTHGRTINNNGHILVRASTKAALLTPINVPFADLNYDCSVDVYDLLILLEQWGPIPREAATGEGIGMPSGDLNGDGVVNVLDLLILLENWNP